MPLENVIAAAACLAALAWAALLLLPWQPWRTRERLNPVEADPSAPLDSLTVLIPARNEAAVLPATLAALAAQGSGLRVLVVDDESTDDTAMIARQQSGLNLTVLVGSPMPAGWTGKIWALEQGRQQVSTEYILLLDADITLAPGMIAALLQHSRAHHLGLVSVMAELRMVTVWEKLLSPAFIFFFKLLYPFALANQPHSKVAAAAGGCILIRTAVLDSLGGFGSIRDALIDDCALAARTKAQGYRTWIGLSRSVRSHRGYESLREFWNMVARTAYTQLRYSLALLLLTTALMLLLFWGPVAALVVGWPRPLVALAGLALMGISYGPALRYYGRSPCWVLALPFIASLFLLMTWTSAVRYWFGQRSAWKNRTYLRPT